MMIKAEAILEKATFALAVTALAINGLGLLFGWRTIFGHWTGWRADLLAIALLALAVVMLATRFQERRSPPR